jgi:DNA polymerase-1
MGFERFSKIWMVDFEFISEPGELPVVVCMVAREYRTGEVIRVWENEFCLGSPSFLSDQECLVVAYFASAEVGCFLELGWPLPNNLIDLYVEFRALTNGMPTPCGNGLLGALAYFGLSSIDAVEKDEMRELILSGGPWSEMHRLQILDYCQTDVDALIKLLAKMECAVDVERSLVRGRYMIAVAVMERIGIPVDTECLGKLKEKWNDLKSDLIKKVNEVCPVFEGDTFKLNRFAEYLVEHQIAWPRLPTGGLDLKDSTFKSMALRFPELNPLRELRYALSQLRLAELPVGSDGRNRCLLSPFRARTGRNQPSNSKFIFGPSVWLRGLIKPSKGFAIAYIDWSQQEFGIAAALSGDPLMQEAYLSGDPYLAFAKQAGAVPDDATKQTHKLEREQFKACVLAVQYGMGAEALADKIGQPVVKARQLLKMHRDTYRAFWKWSDSVLDNAHLHGRLWTVFGWPIRLSGEANPRSLQNFPMQANGAEMLRIACSLMVESGITLCAPIHDAVLIEAQTDQIDQEVTRAKKLMAEASAIVLNGFHLRSDAEIYRYPERYSDERGSAMWTFVMEAVNELDCEASDGS